MGTVLSFIMMTGLSVLFGMSPHPWAPSACWIFVGVMSLIDFSEGLGNRKGGDVMGRPVVVLWISSGRSWCS